MPKHPPGLERPDLQWPEVGRFYGGPMDGVQINVGRGVTYLEIPWTKRDRPKAYSRWAQAELPGPVFDSVKYERKGLSMDDGKTPHWVFWAVQDEGFKGWVDEVQVTMTEARRGDEVAARLLRDLQGARFR